MWIFVYRKKKKGEQEAKDCEIYKRKRIGRRNYIEKKKVLRIKIWRFVIILVSLSLSLSLYLSVPVILLYFLFSSSISFYVCDMDRNCRCRHFSEWERVSFIRWKREKREKVSRSVKDHTWTVLLKSQSKSLLLLLLLFLLLLSSWSSSFSFRSV